MRMLGPAYYYTNFGSHLFLSGIPLESGICAASSESPGSGRAAVSSPDHCCWHGVSCCVGPQTCSDNPFCSPCTLGLITALRLSYNQVRNRPWQHSRCGSRLMPSAAWCFKDVFVHSLASLLPLPCPCILLLSVTCSNARSRAFLFLHPTARWVLRSSPGPRNH